MSMHGENVDRSAIDKENLNYFMTLLRHLHRIPESRILLFRQEVDALLLKYALHYVRNSDSPVVMARETRKKRMEQWTTDSDTTEEDVAPSKGDKKKSKGVPPQAMQSSKHKRVRKAMKVTSSNDDGIVVIREIKKPQTSKSSPIKEESAREVSNYPVKIERVINTPAPNGQEAPTGPSYPNTSAYQESNYHPQQRMSNNSCDFYNATSQAPAHHQSHEQQIMNNTGRYYTMPTKQQTIENSMNPYNGQNTYNRYDHKEMPSAYNSPPSTQNGCSNPHLSAQYRHPTGTHPPQHPSVADAHGLQNNQVGHQSTPNKQQHSSPSGITGIHPSQHPSVADAHHGLQNNQVGHQSTPYKQQHSSPSGIDQDSTWQNTHPLPHDHVHGAPSRNGHGFSTTDQSSTQDQGRAPRQPSNIPILEETTEQSELLKL